MIDTFILLSTPEIVDAGRVTISGSDNDEHACDFHSVDSMDRQKSVILYYIKSGIATIVCNQDGFKASVGCLLAFGSDDRYKITSKGYNYCELVFISLKGIRYGGFNDGYLPYADKGAAIDIVTNAGLIDSLFEAILQEVESKRNDWQQLSSKLCDSLFMYIHRNVMYEDPESEKNVTSIVRQYIESNYHQIISLNDLSNIVFISPYHLARMFKNEMGISPIQYLIQCRMKKAKSLLQSTKLSVAEISNAVGYPNPNYFSMMFKRITGKTPGKYRKDT